MSRLLQFLKSTLVTGLPVVLLAWLALLPAAPAAAQDDLAQQLANPVSSLISVPFQSNWDFGIGPFDASRYTLNIQPVVPLSLDEEWNLIVRTIVPVIDAESPAAGVPDASGLGDIVVGARRLAASGDRVGAHR